MGLSNKSLLLVLLVEFNQKKSKIKAIFVLYSARHRFFLLPSLAKGDGLTLLISRWVGSTAV